MAALGRLARRRELRSLTGGVVSLTGEGAVTGSFSWAGMGVEEVAEVAEVVEEVEEVVDVRRGWTTRG